jgi:hypothetical protein
MPRCVRYCCTRRYSLREAVIREARAHGRHLGCGDLWSSIVGRAILVRPASRTAAIGADGFGKLPANSNRRHRATFPTKNALSERGNCFEHYNIGSTSTGTGKGSPHRLSTTADNEYVTADLL